MIKAKDIEYCPKCSFPLYVIGYENGHNCKVGHCQRCTITFQVSDDARCTSFAEHEYLKKQFYKKAEVSPLWLLIIIVIPIILIMLGQLLGFFDWLDAL